MLVVHTPDDSNMAILFFSQIATLAVPVSGVNLEYGQIIESGNRTYTRSTIKREAEASAIKPKNYKKKTGHSYLRDLRLSGRTRRRVLTS